MFDIYKINVQYKKSNNKHPCEFVLTRVVKLLHVIFLRLQTSKTEKRHIISSISTKTTLEQGNKSYGTAGENKVSLSHSGYTSGLGAIHPPCHDG